MTGHSTNPASPAGLLHELISGGALEKSIERSGPQDRTEFLTTDRIDNV